jgi:hypothetical protein
MHQPTPKADAESAAWAQCLADASDALDGFPVTALILSCQSALDRDPQGLALDATTVSQTLANWSELLDKDIQAFPPSPTDTLARMKQRLICTRDALATLQQHFAAIERMRASVNPCSPSAWEGRGIARGH